MKFVLIFLTDVSVHIKPRSTYGARGKKSQVITGIIIIHHLTTICFPSFTMIHPAVKTIRGKHKCRPAGGAQKIFRAIRIDFPKNKI